MSEISLALVIAVIVEALMEYGKTVYTTVREKDYRLLLRYQISLLLSLFFCILSRADLFTALDVNLGSAWVGILLTAVFASRGVGYLQTLVEHIWEQKE